MNTLPTRSALESVRRLSWGALAIPLSFFLDMCCLRGVGIPNQWSIAARFLHRPAYRCTRDSMLLGDLRQAHAGAAVMDHLLSVNVEPSASDLPPFKTRPPHPCTDSLD